MKLLTDYFELQKKIFEFFDCKENWRAIPLDDSRQYFWRLDGEGPGNVCFADTEHELLDEDGNYYENEIYTQGHLNEWVYRGNGYTMICVDTRTDGNLFLQVFDNSKERPLS